MNNLINAYFITDHSGNPVIPDPLLPQDPVSIFKAGQQDGTPLERLVEIAGRVCYDSYGKGRCSADFHKHILEVGHLSVLEHAVFTVDLPLKPGGGPQDLHALLACFMNKPSLFVRTAPGGGSLRVTLNLRHVMEWKYGNNGIGTMQSLRDNMLLCPALKKAGHRIAPQIVPADDTAEAFHCPVVPPETPEEQWITLLLTGSRGFSHEQVRHGDWTAISQRSTRYVDESESPWVEHPLMTAFLKDAGERNSSDLFLAADVNSTIDSAKSVYRAVVAKLEPWLISKGVDKFTARKQARGAARGYLGNALYTEVVFSASVAQWLRMSKARACGPADAEIREVFCKALPHLQASRYGAAFAHLELAPSPDGIGQVAVEKT